MLVSGMFHMTVFLLQDSEKSAPATNESDKLGNQEEIMLDSASFVTKKRGKEKRTTRKKRNCNDETNTNEENTGLSDGKEVIYMAYFCVLAALYFPKHNLNTLV